MRLEVRGIKKSFGDKEVLHGISFEVASGRAMGFLGRNGAGKSTTIRCLMDVFHQDEGGFYMDSAPLDIKKHRVGYLPEERGMYQKHTVTDQLCYFARLRGASAQEAKATSDKWVDYFGLSEYKNKKLETLSKGNQQKIQIAQCFLNEPEILILDEPFSGLDPVNARVFKDAIRGFVREGRLVIFSSHQMGYVEEVCDDITLIHEGRILLSGSLDAIKREMGEGKLQLRAEGLPDAALADKMKAAFPGMDSSAHENGLILDTKGEIGQNDILRFVQREALTILSFGLYTPSLNDIFIAKAGEQA